MNIGTSFIQKIHTPEEREPLSEKTRIELRKLKESSQQVEAIFVKDLLARMRKTSLSEESSGGMNGLAWDLFDQAVSQALSKKDVLGLSKIVYEKGSEQIIQKERALKALEEKVYGQSKATTT